MNTSNENLTVVNASRNSVNNNISKFRYLGKAKRFAWANKRTYRTI